MSKFNDYLETTAASKKAIRWTDPKEFSEHDVFSDVMQMVDRMTKLEQKQFLTAFKRAYSVCIKQAAKQYKMSEDDLTSMFAEMLFDSDNRIDEIDLIQVAFFQA